MPDAAHDLRKEFWRPPAHTESQHGPAAASMTAIACPRCGTEFVVGARFCHVCGSRRGTAAGAGMWARLARLQRIPQVLDLSTGAVAAFLLGIACVVAAIATGLIYSANTMLDWQAIQVWRIEWLLAAIIAFLAGILLKRAPA